MSTGRILTEVHTERMRQKDLRGTQNHSPLLYWAIFMEEVGETTDATLAHETYGSGKDLDHLRTELIQVAAVAVAMVECIDRAEWPDIEMDELTRHNLIHIAKQVNHWGRASKRRIERYFSRREKEVSDD